MSVRFLGLPPGTGVFTPESLCSLVLSLCMIGTKEVVQCLKLQEVALILIRLLMGFSNVGLIRFFLLCFDFDIISHLSVFIFKFPFIYINKIPKVLELCCNAFINVMYISVCDAS